MPLEYKGNVLILKRVLTFSTPDGGIGQYTYCLCSSLQRLYHLDISVVVHKDRPYDMATFPHQHVVKPILRQATSRLTRLTVPYFNLRDIMREARHADLFHAQWNNGPRFDSTLWKLLKKAKKPIVYTAHDVAPHERAKADTDHNIWMHQNADAIIVHGVNLKNQLISLSGVDPQKIHIIPHGNFIPIASHFDNWSRDRARKSFGISDQEQVVLFFGFVRPYKGLDVLIEACAQIREANPNAFKSLRLLVAGQTMGASWETGKYAEQLRDLGLDSITTCAIEYIPMEDVGRYFQAADIVALPYKSGSQSGILQMAYAYSKPAIVTDVGSISEIVQDGNTGLVVPPNDVDGFSAALSSLLDDPLYAKRIGRQGLQYASEEFSWDLVASKTMDLYRSVTADSHVTAHE